LVTFPFRAAFSALFFQLASFPQTPFLFYLNTWLNCFDAPPPPITSLFPISNPPVSLSHVIFDLLLRSSPSLPSLPRWRPFPPTLFVSVRSTNSRSPSSAPLADCNVLFFALLAQTRKGYVSISLLSRDYLFFPPF